MEVPYIFRKQQTDDGLVHQRDDYSWWLALCGAGLLKSQTKDEDEVVTCLRCIASS
jgi:hypothetical protein